MIVLKNMSEVIDEDKTQPLVEGGEMESSIARKMPRLMLEAFGVVCVAEVNTGD